jgi:succinate-acetate transporter protein
MAATIPADRWTPAGPIRSHLPMDEIEREEGLAASSVADPTTMGLYGFAAATFTLSAVNAGWFPATTAIFAAPVVLVVGGIVQFSAGVWAFRKGDTFAASGFGAIGGFNVAYGLYQLLSHTGVVSGPGAGAGVIGIFLACFGLIATIQMVAALWKNMALVVTFLFLALTYGLLGAGNIAAGAPNLLHYGGLRRPHHIGVRFLYGGGRGDQQHQPARDPAAGQAAGQRKGRDAQRDGWIFRPASRTPRRSAWIEMRG